MRQASVIASGERAMVRCATTGTRMAAIVAAIRRAGCDALPDAALSACQARMLEYRAAVWHLFVAAFCAMQVMRLAMPGYGAVGDDLAHPTCANCSTWPAGC